MALPSVRDAARHDKATELPEEFVNLSMVESRCDAVV